MTARGSSTAASTAEACLPLHSAADEARPLRILFCGRVVPDKRPDLFVDVVAELARSRPVEAAVVGDGGDLPAPAHGRSAPADRRHSFRRPASTRPTRSCRGGTPGPISYLSPRNTKLRPSRSSRGKRPADDLLGHPGSARRDGEWCEWLAGPGGRRGRLCRGRAGLGGPAVRRAPAPRPARPPAGRRALLLEAVARRLTRRSTPR